MYRRQAHVPADIQSLDFMSSRLREGETPSHRQIEQTLERGFGKLMQLEADLQKQRAAAPSAGGDATTDLAELEAGIAALREALTVLRTLSSPPGPPRIGYGFVLPPRAGGGRSRHSS
jgi:hypothetical protein